MEDLKLLRAYKGISQEQAAVKMGMSRLTLQKAESGKAISLKHMVSIAKFYKITLDDLKGDK